MKTKPPKAILLTWNPKIPWGTYNIEKELGKEGMWSCAHIKNIPVGTEFFLLKQREEPRGIIARGITTSLPTPTEEGNFLGIRFLEMVEKEKALPIEILKEKTSSQNWRPQNSGQTIKEENIAEIKRLWEEHIQRAA